MPVYSLNDQGWFDGSRAIMQGIAGYRQKKQQDLENKRWDDEFGLQRQKLDFDRESTQQRTALDQSRFEEDRKNYEINRQLMQKKLAPVTQFDPAQHVKTLPDGTQVIVDPETGTPTKVIEKNPMVDPMVDLIRGMVTQPGAQPSTGGLPPDGTNTVLAPSAGTPDLPVQQPQGAGPSPVMTGFGPQGPTFQMRYPVEKPSVVEMDVPGQGKQLFLQTVDPSTGQPKVEPYRTPDSAGKITERQTTEANFKAARRYAQEMKDAIERSGTYESGVFGSPDDAATLQRNPYLMAIAMAKVLDPGSVAREGEVDAAKKFLVPLGAFASKDTSLASIQKHLADLDVRAADLGIQPPGSIPDAPPPKITSQAEYDALPVGKKFIDSSGMVKTKKSR